MTLHEPDLRVALSDAQMAGAAGSFARSGVVRIGEFYDPGVAEALWRHLDSQLPWTRAVSRGGTALELGSDLIAAMDSGHGDAILAAIHDGARHGFQFLYDSVITSDDAAARKARGLLLDRVIDAFNHPTSLAAFRAITGVAEIRRVNGQASRYLPGHFLTSHDDGIDGQDRVAAYVLNLTRDWREDWGGMLQFHTASGDIALSLKPRFNAMNLFRVPQMHSVSYVAPFAAVPRYAIIGWLCR